MSVVVFCEDISLYTYNMSQYNEMIDKCKSSLHSSICCFMSDVSSTSIFSDITYLSAVFSTNYFYLSHTITLLLVFWNVTLQKQCLLIKQSFTHQDTITPITSTHLMLLKQLVASVFWIFEPLRRMLLLVMLTLMMMDDPGRWRRQ